MGRSWNEICDKGPSTIRDFLAHSPQTKRFSTQNLSRNDTLNVEQPASRIMEHFSECKDERLVWNCLEIADDMHENYVPHKLTRYEFCQKSDQASNSAGRGTTSSEMRQWFLLSSKGGISGTHGF